jgi:hypothetical protein
MPQQVEDRVPIISPQGQTGTILRSELDQALKEGYKLPPSAHPEVKAGFERFLQGFGIDTSKISSPAVSENQAIMSAGKDVGKSALDLGAMVAFPPYGIYKLAKGAVPMARQIGGDVANSGLLPEIVPPLKLIPGIRTTKDAVPGSTGAVLGDVGALGLQALIGHSFSGEAVRAPEKVAETTENTLRGGARVLTNTGKTFETLSKQSYEKRIAEYRTELEQAKLKHAEEVQKVGENNAQLQAKHALEVQEIKDKHAARIASDRQAYLDREAAYVKRMQDYLQGQATTEQKFNFEHQQGKEFEYIAKQARDLADNQLPKTFKAVKQANDTRWNAFKLALGDRNVPQEPIYNAILDAEDNILAGSHEKIALFREILKDAEDGNPLNQASVFRGRETSGIQSIKQLLNNPAMSESQRARLMQTLQEGGENVGEALRPDFAKDVPFDEARRTYTALNRAEQRALNGGHGEVYRAIKSVKSALEKEITNVVPENLRPQLESLKQDYGQFAQDWYNKKSPLYRLQKALTDQQRIDLISGQHGDNLIEALDRYKTFGAEPKLAQAIREAKQYVQRMKAKNTTPPQPILSAKRSEPGMQFPPPPELTPVPEFAPPPPPPPLNMYDARMQRLWDEFQAAMGAGRTVGDNPVQRWRLMNGLYRRALAKFLADEARRRWIAGGQR